MRLLRSKKKAPCVRLIQIAKQEWTKDDGTFIKHLVDSLTFPRLKAVLNQYLINSILRGVSDDYRRGYLDCMANLEAIGRVDNPIEDSGELVSMQEFDDD